MHKKRDDYELILKRAICVLKKLYLQQFRICRER